MSAFIVTKTHIDAIVTTISSQTCYSVKELVKNYQANFDLIGQILWNENYKSVNYRYNENEPNPTYFFSYKFVNLGQSLKAIDCLNYQSCEHPDYEKSEAKNILNTLGKVLLGKMKELNTEYQKAEWLIE